MTFPAAGEYAPPAAPHFLWVTEFPLFTRADEDKEALARGRWSSSHHPFTAPMWEDVRALYEGRVGEVRLSLLLSLRVRSLGGHVTC